MVSTHRLMIDVACYILKESGRNVMVKLNNRLTKISLMQELKTDLELVHMYDCDIEEISEDMSPYCPMLSTMILKLRLYILDNLNNYLIFPIYCLKTL